MITRAKHIGKNKVRLSVEVPEDLYILIKKSGIKYSKLMASGYYTLTRQQTYNSEHMNPLFRAKAKRMNEYPDE